MKVKGIIAVLLGMALIFSGCGGESGGGKEECAHIWSTWTEETAPTCTKDGVERRVCSKCDKEERQIIPARGHAQGVWESDEEYHWQECPVCKEALTQKEPHTAENGECTVCGEEIVGLEYAVYENECHVIGIGTESGEIVIPAVHFGKPVTEIAEKAFYYEDITSVVIPDSVKYIRRIAFSSCSSLRRVQLGNSVKEIGEQAFNWDTVLSDIELPASLETIGEVAFGYTAFAQINFPSSLRKIGQEAFYGAAIQSATVPGSVTEFGIRIFYQCKSLQSVRFEKGVKEIPRDACCGCDNLTTVSLPDGLETIGDAAFKSCHKLSAISIPTSVQSIGEGAFEYTGLTEITIPDTVETLGGSAFYNCQSLVRAVVGNGIKSLGEMGQISSTGVFEGCAALVDLTIGSGVKSIA